MGPRAYHSPSSSFAASVIRSWVQGGSHTTSTSADLTPRPSPPRTPPSPERSPPPGIRGWKTATSTCPPRPNGCGARSAMPGARATRHPAGSEFRQRLFALPPSLYPAAASGGPPPRPSRGPHEPHTAPARPTAGRLEPGKQCGRAGGMEGLADAPESGQGLHQDGWSRPRGSPSVTIARFRKGPGGGVDMRRFAPYGSVS